MSIPLAWYLFLAAGLFCIGLYGALSRRNAIAILLSIELMLNAVNINLVAFWRYLELAQPSGIVSMGGQVFAVVVFAVSAAEVAVGLALILSVYRLRKTVIADDINLMKW